MKTVPLATRFEILFPNMQIAQLVGWRFLLTQLQGSEVGSHSSGCTVLGGTFSSVVNLPPGATRLRDPGFNEKPSWSNF